MTWEKEEKTMKHRIKILLLAVLIAALCNCMLMIGMTKKKENNTIPKRCKPDLRRNRIAETRTILRMKKTW